MSKPPPPQVSLQPLHEKISEQDAKITNLTNEISQIKENEAE
jgi:hypothetical protein